MVTGQRPGFIEKAIAVAGTSFVVLGPGVPVALIAIRTGTSGLTGSLTYSPTESSYSTTTGAVTIKCYTDVAATYRILPIYGVSAVVV